MSNKNEANAVVTFAIYDEAPIACQGDDDQQRITVVRDRISATGDMHTEALHRACMLSDERGLHVQVWDVTIN